MLRNEFPLALHPIVVDGNVFVANSTSVFAFDIETGQPAWAGDESDSAAIFPSRADDRLSLHLPDTGVASYTLSASAGRLFARLGAPFLRKSPRETNTVSEIVGLDVGQREGQLDLRITSNQIEPASNPTQAAASQFEKSPQATTWSFEGAPVVSEERLFVSLRQGSPEDRTIVACFDARTGKLVWRSGIVASLTNLPDHLNLLGTSLLTLDNGRLFLTTGTGAIAALNAESGRVLWMVTYESLESGSLEELSDPRRFGLAPCLSAHGIVIVAPQDSELLFALEAASGRLVWSHRLPRQARHLVGVNDGRLFVAGDSLQAFDLLTGIPAWPQPVSFSEHAGQTFGRPVLTHDEILWPQHDKLLYVGQSDGAIRGLVNLREAFGISAGNLLIHGDRLIIAQSDGLLVLAAD
jgi:outer membrane protein assembly factor BamB